MVTELSLTLRDVVVEQQLGHSQLVRDPSNV
jgi:hypothetical protein